MQPQLVPLHNQAWHVLQNLDISITDYHNSKQPWMELRANQRLTDNLSHIYLIHIVYVLNVVSSIVIVLHVHVILSPQLYMKPSMVVF